MKTSRFVSIVENMGYQVICRESNPSNQIKKDDGEHFIERYISIERHYHEVARVYPDRMFSMDTSYVAFTKLLSPNEQSVLYATIYAYTTGKLEQRSDDALYTVSINNQYVVWDNSQDTRYRLVTYSELDDIDPITYKLTEDDIKFLDERLLPFKTPVPVNNESYDLNDAEYGKVDVSTIEQLYPYNTDQEEI